MIQWLKRLINAFGTSFLWLICLIYFTQGFRSFVSTAISYQLKDRLKLSPSSSQFVSSIVYFPWSIKPLYGILSDCIPIRGRKRIPYLLIATVLSLFPWLFLGIDASLRSSQMHLIIFLSVQNVGSAMADVVIDAMIAEAVRFERASFSGDLQSISWMAMAFGGVCGNFLGGYALTHLQIDNIFLLFSVLPTLQFLSCFLVKEIPVGSKALPEFPNSESFTMADKNTSVLDHGKLLIEKSDTNNTLRRKKNRKNNKKRHVDTDKFQISEKGNTLSLPWFQSLKTAGYSLFRSFRQPIILRPMAWFFLAHVTVPDMSTVMFYYQTDFLKLDASFLGTTRVVRWLGLMLGTFIYNRYLKHMKLRKILMWAHVGLCSLSLLDIVLVSRLNVAFDISDKFMVLCAAVLSAIHQFKFMPFLILSGRLCPPGIEGTLFALFMSINNLGSTISSLLGAGVASVLKISSGSFDNLIFGIVIEMLCIFIPTAFLFLIPKEATGAAP